MFDVGLLPLLLESAGVIEVRPANIRHPIEIARSHEPTRDRLVETYLRQIEAAGFAPARQGVWMQTGDRLLVANGGDKLHSGASLTKAATTLAVLHQYAPDHRFQTRVGRTGEIENGVLKGDLVIDGGMDLLFMRAAAIAFGNQLESLGIQKIEGDLVVNFPHVSALPTPENIGTVLREGMNVDLWSEDTIRHYQQHLPNAKKPAVVVSGGIKPFVNPLAITQDLLLHESPSVIEILKYMNLHSNNNLAEALTADLGGSAIAIETILTASGLPPAEVQLINGSGLGEENRMTPRAVVGIFMAIQQRLDSLDLDLQAVFPVSGQDIGTLEDRNLPPGAVVKTGTLWNVSALAGYIPTVTQGRVWFAIMNEGGDYINGFRQSQDKILNQMVQHLASPS